MRYVVASLLALVGVAPVSAQVCPGGVCPPQGGYYYQPAPQAQSYGGCFGGGGTYQYAPQAFYAPSQPQPRRPGVRVVLEADVAQGDFGPPVFREATPAYMSYRGRPYWVAPQVIYYAPRRHPPRRGGFVEIAW